MRNCDDDILTTSATARIMDRSESAVRRASDLGLLPVQRTSNGTRLFRRRDVYFPSDVLVYIPSGATSKEATLNALDALRLGGLVDFYKRGGTSWPEHLSAPDGSTSEGEGTDRVPAERRVNRIGASPSPRP
jgi:hypothetical protein